MKYEVEVAVVLTTVETVEANSEKEAKEIVWDMIDNEELYIEPDYPDYHVTIMNRYNESTDNFKQCKNISSNVKGKSRNRKAVNEAFLNITDLEDNEEAMEFFDEIVDSYTTSNPISGSWETEELNLVCDIMTAFGLTEKEALSLCYKYLGWEDVEINLTENDIIEYLPTYYDTFKQHRNSKLISDSPFA